MEDNKEIFVAYKFKDDSTIIRLFAELKKKIGDDSRYVVQLFKVDDVALAKIVPRKISRIVNINEEHPNFVVASYTDYKGSDTLEKNEYLSNMYGENPDTFFSKLKENIACSTVIYDLINKTLVAGTTNSKNKDTELYYGHTNNEEELMISNDSSIISKFCDKVCTMSDDKYMSNGEIYSIADTKNKVKTSKKNKTKMEPLTEDICLKLIEDSLYSQLDAELAYPYYKAIKRYSISRDTSSVTVECADLKDVEKISSLAMTSITVLDLYARLYASEVDGQKDSEDYKKLLNYLKIALEVEEREYKNLNISFPKLLYYINDQNFVTRTLEKKLFESGNVDITQVNSMQLSTRFLNYLLNNSNSYKNIFDIIPSGLIAILKKNNVANPVSTIEEAVRTSFEEQKIFCQDVARAFQFFINKEIEDDKKIVNRDSLIFHKYKESIICPCIENELIEEEFSPCDSIGIDTNLNAAFLGLSKEKYADDRSSFAKNAAIEEIYGLLSIPDADYEDLEISSLSIFKQCNLRSNLIFMNDNDIESLKDELYDIVHSNEYLEEHKYDHISRNLIENSINGIEEDKKLIKDETVVYKKEKK